MNTQCNNYSLLAVLQFLAEAGTHTISSHFCLILEFVLEFSDNTR